MDTLYIVMPAYNEEEGIEAVVRDWYRVLEGKGAGSRLVVADAGSTDRTHEILRQLCDELPQLEILTGTEKQHGPKLIALYHYAIGQGADYIFQTDSDGQTDPDEFEGFWKKRRIYDALIGYRPDRRDGRERKFVENMVCFLLWIYFGVKVPDANAPFRLMEAGLVARYIDRLPEDYNIPNIMLTAYFAANRENIAFRRIKFLPRQSGENSINMKKIVKTGMRSLRDFRHFRRDMKKEDL